MNLICFFRHGATAGNLERRYIGKTDEPLCKNGVLQAEAVNLSGLPPFNVVFFSPYLRCRQTANVLFPRQKLEMINDLRECDFGIFEGHTAQELANCEEYNAWLLTSCEGAIPGGEAVFAFKERCCRAFLEIAAALPSGKSAAIVTHGGCIMAVLEKFALPRRSFYEYHIGNCEWILCEYENGALKIVAESRTNLRREIMSEDKKCGFFQHAECEYFPCHETEHPEDFNCLFCYCPLYALGESCGGSFCYTEKGVKDCSRCIIPHGRSSAKLIASRCDELAKLAAKKQG